MSKCCEDVEEWTEEDGSITISIPVHLSQETLQEAMEAWIAGDDSSSLRDHLFDRVEVSPVFVIDGDEVE